MCEFWILHIETCRLFYCSPRRLIAYTQEKNPHPAADVMRGMDTADLRARARESVLPAWIW